MIVGTDDLIESEQKRKLVIFLPITIRGALRDTDARRIIDLSGYR